MSLCLEQVKTLLIQYIAYQELRKKYRSAGDIVRFYRKSASTLIGYLQTKSELFDKDWIDDWFPSEEIEDQTKPRRKRKKKKKSDNDPEDTDEDDLIVGPKPPKTSMKGIRSNCRNYKVDLSIHGEIALGLDLLFRVKMGYSRDDGKDAIKKWKTFDFTKTLTTNPLELRLKKSKETPFL